MHECLTRDELRGFLLGRVDEPTWQVWETEIDDCDRCREALEGLDQADSFVEEWQTIKEVEPHDAFADEPHCQWVVDRLCDEPQPLPQPPLQPGSLIGSYRLQDPLGRGGMGMVYRGVHTKLKRTVAIKVLSSGCTPTAAQVARFEREMEAVGRVDHPNLVRADDAGECGGVPYLVMEHVDGIDLAELVRVVGPLPAAEACEIIRQAALALQAIHEHGLVHRDVKPSNIMVTRQGQIKLLDLGLAMLDQHHARYDRELTTVGQFMGTLDYMSPEQATDCREVDARSDLFSLGATLFKLLTGRAPWEEPRLQNPVRKVAALVTREAPLVSSLSKDLPPALVEVTAHLLARDPRERFARATDVVTAVAPLAEEARLKPLVNRAMRQRQRSQPNFASMLDGQQFGGPEKGPVGRRGFRWWGWLVALACCGLLAWGGIQLYLETGRGTLIVQCDQPHVQVLLRSGRRAVYDWELNQGDNETRLRAGRYELLLKTPTDGLRVVDGTFTLSWKGRAVVKIHHRPAAPAGGIMGSEPGMAAGMAGPGLGPGGMAGPGMAAARRPAGGVMGLGDGADSGMGLGGLGGLGGKGGSTDPDMGQAVPRGGASPYEAPGVGGGRGSAGSDLLGGDVAGSGGQGAGDDSPARDGGGPGRPAIPYGDGAGAGDYDDGGEGNPYDDLADPYGGSRQGGYGEAGEGNPYGDLGDPYGGGLEYGQGGEGGEEEMEGGILGGMTEYGQVGGLGSSAYVRRRLTYDGRSLADWQREIRFERKPERQLEALRAVLVLLGQQQPRLAFDSIMTIAAHWTQRDETARQTADTLRTFCAQELSRLLRAHAAKLVHQLESTMTDGELPQRKLVVRCWLSIPDEALVGLRKLAPHVESLVDSVEDPLQRDRLRKWLEEAKPLSDDGG